MVKRNTTTPHSKTVLELVRSSTPPGRRLQGWLGRLSEQHQQEFRDLRDAFLSGELQRGGWTLRSIYDTLLPEVGITDVTFSQFQRFIYAKSKN